MHAMLMNSDPHRLLLNFPDKIKLNRSGNMLSGNMLNHRN